MAKGPGLLKRTALALTVPVFYYYFSLFFFAPKFSTKCEGMLSQSYYTHSKIWAPKNRVVNCYYDPKTEVKISMFALKERDLENWEKYMPKFTEVENNEGIKALSGSYLLAPDERPTSGNLYIANGIAYDHTWTYVYDERAKILWAEIKYK